VIAELLQSHRSAPPPAGAEEEARRAGLDLPALDAAVVALAEGCLQRGALTGEERERLGGYVAELRRVAPGLHGPVAAHLARLHGLAAAVLYGAAPRGPGI
jgi:hypothetical protein